MHKCTKNILRFSLTELLIVIAILAILLSLLGPSLRQAYETTQAIKCSSDLRYLAGVAFEFADDHDDRSPGEGTKLRSSNGSVESLKILEYYLEDTGRKKIINRTGTMGDRQLGCPNAIDITGARVLGYNFDLKGGINYGSYTKKDTQYGLNIEDQSQWPGPAYGGSLDAYYNLGALMTMVKSPRDLLMIGDHLSNSNSYIQTYSSSPTLYHNTLVLGKAAFRHGVGSLTSTSIYTDMHAEFLEPLVENYNAKFTKLD